jgi:hypothetical protein
MTIYHHLAEDELREAPALMQKHSVGVRYHFMTSNSEERISA